MIAFRKGHPSIGRSCFWRDDVNSYGISSFVDMGFESHTLAYCLHGGDIYVMINAYWRPLEFTIQEGLPEDWRLVVDTGAAPPNDIFDQPNAPSINTLVYTVGPRSVVALIRTSKEVRRGTIH